MKYPLHPTTIKLIKKGHPWVTKDQYSVKFPAGTELLKLGDNQNKPLGYFLHDPEHPRVKARFLAKEVTSLNKFIEWALKQSIEKRRGTSWKRENYYLCFGEVDQLPGLYIKKLGEHILIQYHAYIWGKYLKLITKTLRTLVEEKHIWTQMRIPGEQKKAPATPGYDAPTSFVVIENTIKFQIKMDLNHDIGLYTDMSSIRERIKPYFTQGSSTLNLFSYTGAFSLQALKSNNDVTSVDLSRTYMNWLEENIELNKFDKTKHKSIIGPAHKALAKIEKSFDCLVCDPPSFSTNGKKRESSFDFYKKNWDLLWSKVNPNGYMIVFLNTHSVTRDKFRKLVREKISSTQIKGKIVKELTLNDDCPIMPNFPEGDYLKGFVIKKA